MIVWGGFFNSQLFNTGGRYNPFTDSWTTTSTLNVPEARLGQTAVWTGGQMIVWGGAVGLRFLNTGGKYCAEVGPTPTPTPVPITLHGEGKKVQGINTVRLTWSGATSANVDVYRDGGVIVTTANDGLYVDSIGNGSQADYHYLVCEAGSQTCSNEVVVGFKHQTIDATWSANPVSGDWNDPLNWTPHTVPNGQFAKATFNTSIITDISLSDTTAVKEIVFNSGASAFTFTIPAQKTLAFNGSGVTNSSAQEQNFVITNGGVIKFQGTATAGSNALYSCDGAIHFYDSSNAGEGTFVYSGGTVTGHGGGFADFRDNSGAGNATFIVEAGTMAGTSGGSVAFFDGQVSAGNATIIVNGGTIAGADGGELTFFAIQPSEPTIICNGGLNGGTGAKLMFFQDIPGNLAHVRLTGDAFMDMSITGGVTLGSLEGHGIIDLGDFTLTVGGNNQDTLFSGLLDQINTEGFDAGLKKVGSGTLRLSHNNMFKGGITIAGGMLVLQNTTGSASGSDGVTVEEGTLGGSGITAGAVQIGTGSGSGAFLAPGQAASNAETLNIQQSVTFKADGTYTWKFNTNKATADQVATRGVTIQAGAQFNFNAVGNKTLTTGTVFTAISNASAIPISGTFSNLADGSTVTVGVNKLQVNYSGGDGNDLTLTVVP
jgi:autotransporter-associated beta strand protein